MPSEEAACWKPSWCMSSAAMRVKACRRLEVGSRGWGSGCGSGLGERVSSRV